VSRRFGGAGLPVRFSAELMRVSQGVSMEMSSFTTTIHGRALGQPSLSVPPRDDLSRDMLEAPDHPFIRAALGALMCAGPAAAAAGWRLGERGPAFTCRLGLSSVEIGCRTPFQEHAWTEVLDISPLALDLFMLVVDMLTSDGRSRRLVRLRDVLSAKDCRRFGQERLGLEAQLRRELLRLAALRCGGADAPLFSVSPANETATSFVVAVHPHVRSAWRDAPVRRLSRRLVRLDHRANRGADVLAKKVGLYLSFAGSGTGPVVRTVGAILKATGLPPSLVAETRAGRVADRFGEALLRLEEAGLFTAAYRGGGAEIEASRVKGWIRRWLAAELLVMPLLGAGASSCALRGGDRTGRAPPTGRELLPQGA
jgi:hypothetical protein